MAKSAGRWFDPGGWLHPLWSEINQLLTICKLTLRLNCLELAHKPAHKNFGCGGASGAKLLENTEWGQFQSASESFELVSSSQ
jgi:hypothetical protein